MKKAYIFPGQASQFVGMGKGLYDSHPESKELINRADEILGYKLSEVMFNGPEDTLKQTKITQPAVFLHSMLVYNARDKQDLPDAVAGHSLGEITALTVADVLSFEEALLLVQKRADAMQEACEKNPGTMAAILGLDDEKVVEVCQSISDIVIAANFNCPGQLVISGSTEGIEKAMKACSEAGARRALPLVVGGAFHSPLMEPAVSIFKEAIEKVPFKDAAFPVYQNVNALPQSAANVLKDQLVEQITSPVRWTQTIQNMISDGFGSFVEIGGKGKILAGMVRKISRQVDMLSWSEDNA